MKVLTAMLAASLLALDISAGASLPQDPVLDSPVTVAVKGRPFTEALAVLAQKTGARLKVQSGIADERVTIFVDAKPLRRVMEGITTAFGHKWEAAASDAGTTYTLCADGRVAAEEMAKQKQDHDNGMQLAAGFLAYKISLLGKSRSDLLALKADIDKEFETAAKVRKEYYTYREGVNSILEDPLLIPCLQAYKLLSPKALKAIQEGAAVCVDSESNEPEWKLPDGIRKQLATLWAEKYSNDSTSDFVPKQFCISFAIEPNGNGISFKAGVTARDGDSARGLGYPYIYTAGFEPSYDDLPKDNLPHQPVSGPLAGRVTFTGADIVRAAGLSWQNEKTPKPVATVADFLGLLHEKVGLQSICDAYTVWEWNGGADNREMEDLVRNLISARPPRSTWGWDGQFYYARAMMPREAQLREIPERVLARWRQAYARQGGFSLNELAEFGALNDEQWLTLSGFGRHLGFGTEDFKMQHGIGMKMLALLSPQQRQQALAGGVDVLTTTDQQYAALFAMLVPQKPTSIMWRGPLFGIYAHEKRLDGPEQEHFPPKPKPEPIAFGDPPREGASEVIHTDPPKATPEPEQPAGPPEPVLVQIRQGKPYDRQCFLIEQSGGHTVIVDGTSLSETSEKNADIGVDFSKAIQVRLHVVGYEIIVTFTDGSKREEPCGTTVQVLKP